MTTPSTKRQSLFSAFFWTPLRLCHGCLRHRKIATYVVATYLFWVVEAPSVVRAMENSNALFQWYTILVILLSPITVPVGLLGFSAMALFAGGPDAAWNCDATGIPVTLVGYRGSMRGHFLGRSRVCPHVFDYSPEKKPPYLTHIGPGLLADWKLISNLQGFPSQLEEVNVENWPIGHGMGVLV
ncbi:MAG: hypothetical protein IH624_01660 [Phycisphaerae bacterium]|nr:hypothetical protein [Phycisphaerae bacterium]